MNEFLRGNKEHTLLDNLIYYSHAKQKYKHFGSLTKKKYLIGNKKAFFLTPIRNIRILENNFVVFGFV